MGISPLNECLLIFQQLHQSVQDFHRILTASQNSEASDEAETVFGQSVFGHPPLTIFGQSIFGQFVCFNGFKIYGAPEGWGPRRVGGPNPEKVEPRRVGAPKGGGPEGWGPRRVGGPNKEKVGPRRVGPEGWGAQRFALFFPSPAPFSLFLFFSGVFSWNFNGVFEAPGVSNVHVWSSRVVV